MHELMISLTNIIRSMDSFLWIWDPWISGHYY